MSASKLLRTKTSEPNWRERQWVKWIAPTVAAALVLSACGQSDTAADADPSESGGSTSTSYFSPLDEYLNPQGAGQEFDQKEYEAKDREVQELVATCMKDQGFDYIPQDNSGGYAYPMGGDENLSERDMIAKYGYWVTTQLDMQPDPSEMPVDPNQAAYDAMSDGERMAYDMALWGTGVGMMATASAAAGGEATGGEVVASSEVTTTDSEAAETAAATTADAAGSEAAETTGDEGPISIGEEEAISESYAMPTTPEEKGCYGVAQEEIYGDQYGSNINYDEFQDLFDAQSELWNSIDEDPRLAGAVTAWSTCLEGKGYPGFTEMQEPMMDVNRQFAELQGYIFKEYEDGGWGTEPPPGEEMMEPKEPDPAKLAALKDYEIKLALADYDCKGDYQKLFDEVRISLEEQFVEDHKAELERYRDAMNSGGN